MTKLYYVRAIVHATIPAESNAEALALLCQRIRDGIGPDPDDGTPPREWNTAVAAGAASREDGPAEIVRVNTEYLTRLGMPRA